MPVGEPISDTTPSTESAEVRSGVAVAASLAPTQCIHDVKPVEPKPASDAVDDGCIDRQESHRHVENTSQIDEMIVVPEPEPSHPKPKHSAKPGILLNEQSAADTEKLINARTSFDVAAMERDPWDSE